MSRMTLHMLVQLPIIMTAGVLVGLSSGTAKARVAIMLQRAALASPRVVAALWLCITGVTAAWMVPRALDAAVESGVVNALKIGSLLAIGWLAVHAWRHASWVARTFVAGNSLWMMATIGMWYLDAPNRLCTSYARSDQQQVGITLIGITVLAVVAGGWWLLTRRPDRALHGAPS
jgi:hypothetical protein